MQDVQVLNRETERRRENCLREVERKNKNKMKSEYIYTVCAEKVRKKNDKNVAIEAQSRRLVRRV